MSEPSSTRFVSRGGEKLAAALEHFQVDPTGLVCADLGSHVGGFVDCLLQHGAKKVYAVDTSYGTFAWKLRRDPRVVVMERTNAMHASIPEPVDLVTIDVGWTRQTKVLPNVASMLKPDGRVIALIKPHYERQRDRTAPVRPGKGKTHKPNRASPDVLSEEVFQKVVKEVLADIRSLGWSIEKTVLSPIRGHGGNQEMLALLKR